MLLLAGSETLFIIEDLITDESLDKRKQTRLESSISGRQLTTIIFDYTILIGNTQESAKARLSINSNIKPYNEQINRKYLFG